MTGHESGGKKIHIVFSFVVTSVMYMNEFECKKNLNRFFDYFRVTCSDFWVRDEFLCSKDSWAGQPYSIYSISVIFKVSIEHLFGLVRCFNVCVKNQ